MSLCALCSSIPLESLPPFPEDNVTRTLSGLPYLHPIVLRNVELESVGFKHHPDLQSLRDAAATGCSICRLIETQVNSVLADVEGMSEDYRGIYSASRFDLWLTKLPNGRSGFLALTSSTTPQGARGGRQHIYLAAAISFGAEDDDPLAAVFDGRPIKEIPDQDTLRKASRWVKDCDGHKGCVRTETTMPNRLIDVGSTDSGGIVHIVNSSKDIERYVALSHCYKIRDIAELDLISASQESVDVATLPKTFQDAVGVTRGLGVKYLWIDEVCIAREDAKDWARDSARVGDIFTNAYLTLAATGAKDSSEGLFLPRKQREYISIEYTAAGDIKGQLLISTLPLDKEIIDRYYLDMKSEPLSQDVWAFQDRILSYRTLHFASDQTYLECQQGLLSEDGLRQSETWLRQGSLFASVPPDKSKVLHNWYSLLWGYGYRFPDNASDKLPAVANIARVYAEVLQDEYLAGLWKGSILEELCWQSLRGKDLDQASAPSWSWASFGSVAAVGFPEGRTWEPTAKFLSYHTEPQGSDQFGAVKNAWIKIEAPLIPLELAEKKERSSHIFLKTLKGSKDGHYAGLDLIDRKYDKSAEQIKEMETYCLVLGATHPTPESLVACSTGGCTPGASYRCIIVARSEDGESMNRIGFLLVDFEGLSQEELDMRAVVTLK